MPIERSLYRSVQRIPATNKCRESDTKRQGLYSLIQLVTGVLTANFTFTVKIIYEVQKIFQKTAPKHDHLILNKLSTVLCCTDHLILNKLSTVLCCIDHLILNKLSTVLCCTDHLILNKLSTVLCCTDHLILNKLSTVLCCTATLLDSTTTRTRLRSVGKCDDFSV